MSDRLIAQAKNELGAIYGTIYDYSKQGYQLKHSRCQQETILKTKATENIEEYSKSFHTTLDKDLNASEAFAVLHKLIYADDIHPLDKIDLLMEWDIFLGLRFEDALYNPGKDVEIEEKIKKYQVFRSNKQFIQSDALRKEIEGLGYLLRDTATGGTYVVKKFF